MSKKHRWILLDVNYLAYRAFHSTGDLHFKNSPTGVTYGVLSEALRVMERFQTKLVCWCFDYGKPLRTGLLPGYKGARKKARKEKTEAEKQAHENLKIQLDSMRTGLLRDLGFKNVFFEKGFEADDVIAKLAQTIPHPHESIVVSSDQDLYQLLTANSMNWNPHKQELLTHDKFCRVYGITPQQWIDVKALAGCSSDNIPGIPGVGEKTAIKYLKGELKETSKALSLIHI